MKTGHERLDRARLERQRSAHRPSWNTRTSSPNAAPVESRFSRIALIGMTIERNATSSSRNDSARTNAITERHPAGVEVDDVERVGRVAGDERPDAGRPAKAAGTTSSRTCRTMSWLWRSFWPPAMM